MVPFWRRTPSRGEQSSSCKLEVIVCLQNNAIWSVHEGVGGNGVDEVSWCVQFIFSGTAMSL